MNRSSRWLVAIAALGASASGVLAEPKVETTVVAPVRDVREGARYILSPKECHLAAVMPEGADRVVVIHDGEKGPAFDDILIHNGVKHDLFGVAIKAQAQSSTEHVLFTDDGRHWAYAGRTGEAITVFRDGKEYAKIDGTKRTFMGMFYVPGADVLYWESGTQGAAAGAAFTTNFVVNGQPGPDCGSGIQVRFSRDGKRHAYVGTRVGDRNKKFLVIDGKEASYFGEAPVFTGDNKLVTLLYEPSKGKVTLQIDGKAQYSAPSFTQVFTAPHTGRVAAIVGKPEARANVLYLDGKEVPGSAGATEVIFSPDGKRYAARGEGANFLKYFLIDGKRTPDMHIGDAWFTADSSRFVFMATHGSENVMIVNDSMSEGFQVIYKPTFSPDGKRIAYVAMKVPGQNFLIVDDTMIGPIREISNVIFSPDGSRYAFLANDPAQQISGLQIDGEPVAARYGGPIPSNRGPQPVVGLDPVIFSPDGKHTAYLGVAANNPGARVLVVDGKAVPTPTQLITHGVFTPDSKHFLWVTFKNPHYTVWLDGKQVAGWEFNTPTNSYVENVKGNWSMSSEGVLTFLGAEGKDIKRVRITPDDSTGLDKMFAELEAAKKGK